jgi:4'-phosphopantetheinyl transferase
MKNDDSHSDWNKPPDDLELGPHHVDIWRVFLDLPPDSVRSMESTLSADESERAAKFRFHKDRNRYIVSHACLRKVLAHYLRREPAQISFTLNEYGKPFLPGEKLQFNLSHSGDLALIGVTTGRKVGVDIERIRQGISSLVIARQYFSKAEIAELQSLPPEQRVNAFFACWTRKEAYIKAQGLGLSLPLESFDVSLTAGEPAILRATRTDEKEAARWTLRSLPADAEHEAAAAVEGLDIEFRLWDWNAWKSATA